MNKKYKVISAMISFLLVTSLVAGCGSSKTDKTDTAKTGTAAPKETVTVKVWGGVPAENGPDKACQDFTKEFESKGIKAEYTRFVNDDSGNLKLDTALMAGEDVDVFMNYSMDRVKKRYSSQSILDLTPYIKKDNIDLVKDFGPLATSYYVDGKPVVIPTTLSTNNAWIVNKDMFDAAGIPIPTEWTIDDLKDIAKKLTKGDGANKVYGIVFATDNDKQFPFQIAATSLGGDYLFKNGQDKETNFDNPDMLKALKTVTDMMLVDKTAIAHADMITQKLTAQNLFTQGKVAISTHPWIVRDIRDTKTYPHTFKTAFVPAPKMNKDQKDYYAMGSGLSDFISINARSKIKDQAWEYLKWYYAKGVIDMAPGGRIGAYLKLDKDSLTNTFMSGNETLFDTSTFKSVFLKSYEKYQINTILTKQPEIMQVVREECEKAMSGGETPEQAMQNAKKRGDDLLKK